MKWTVTWTIKAEEELTEIWLKATNRKAISRASDQIEKELKHNADRKDTAKNGRRILHYPPLAVAYDVFPEDCLIRIVHVIPETN